MNQVQQAPLSYFHQLINLGGFETERVRFYDRFDYWGEYRPADLIVDRDDHTATYSICYEGEPTITIASLSSQLALSERFMEAANAIYLGIHAKHDEQEQAKYKLELHKELEKMRSNINNDPFTKDYQPLKECIERLTNLVIEDPIVRTEERSVRSIKSFKYKDSNLVRANAKLEDLHNSLIKNNLIDSATTLRQLKAVFNEKIMEHPVRWTGFNWQLNLFIKEIQKSVTCQAEKWVTAATCFVDKQGKPFTNEKLCQVKRPGKKPQAEELVRKIASDFKPDKP